MDFYPYFVVLFGFPFCPGKMSRKETTMKKPKDNISESVKRLVKDYESTFFKSEEQRALFHLLNDIAMHRVLHGDGKDSDE